MYLYGWATICLLSVLFLFNRTSQRKLKLVTALVNDIREKLVFSFFSLYKNIYNSFHDKRVGKSRIFIQMFESILSILASQSVTFNLLPRFVLMNHLNQKALI